MEQILNLLKEKANQGNTNAMVRLAEMYEAGWGTVANRDEAINWLKKAADDATTPSAEACRRLGNLYSIDKNYEEAFEYLLRAAELEDVEAMRLVAIHHHFGYGTNQNIAKAKEWYQKAANSDDWLAKEILAEIDN